MTSGSTGGGVPSPRRNLTLKVSIAVAQGGARRVAAGGWAFARVGRGGGLLRGCGCRAAVLSKTGGDERSLWCEARLGGRDCSHGGCWLRWKQVWLLLSRGDGPVVLRAGTPRSKELTLVEEAPGGGWAGSLKPWLRPGGPSKRRSERSAGADDGTSSWAGKGATSPEQDRLGWTEVVMLVDSSLNGGEGSTSVTHERVTRETAEVLLLIHQENHELSFAGFWKKPCFLEVHHLFQLAATRQGSTPVCVDEVTT